MSPSRQTKVTLLSALLMISACSVVGRREPAAVSAPPVPAVAATPQPPLPSTKPVPPPPPDPFVIPDPIPKFEPRSRTGNPRFYDVFGKRYYVMASSLGYIERGVASWYGPGFHAVRTSIGESYDMYGMSAAHKTLSLPTYVRVTNLQNNRSVIVRVNDRGPFVGNRIIDLSYTAAAKLNMLKSGTAFVEVRAIDPNANPITAVTPVTSTMLTAPPQSLPGPPPAVHTGAGAHAVLFIQAGAFVDSANADKMMARLRSGSFGTVSARESDSNGHKVYRVRIGPIADVPTFDRTVKALERAGVHDAQLAPD